MSSTLRIALVQFDVSWENRGANMRQLESMLYVDEPLDLILLPEMWSTGFSMNTQNIAEEINGPAFEWMRDHSQKLNVVIAGSVAVREAGQYYNRMYVVHPDGRFDHYDKRHLFSYGKEDQHYSRGESRTMMEVKGWKIMPLICYDLRFPVWSRNNEGYDLAIVVANWPTPRIHHWDALLKARAIENQSYIAAVNRIGTDGAGLHYPGHSGIIDMNGNYLLEMKDKEGVGIYQLDKNALIQYREHFRFLTDQDVFHLD